MSTSITVSALSLMAEGGFFVPRGVTVPPRVTLEPDDLVTPSKAAKLLGVQESRVRVWIHRYKIERLGFLGRWPVYDFNEIAVIDARLRRKRQQAAEGETPGVIPLVDHGPGGCQCDSQSCTALAA